MQLFSQSACSRRQADILVRGCEDIIKLPTELVVRLSPFDAPDTAPDCCNRPGESSLEERLKLWLVEGDQVQGG